MSSPKFVPLKSSRSSPAWPSTKSLPSPGSHWKRSSPAPTSALSAPWLPSTWSSPSPPEEQVGAVAAEQGVRVYAAVHRQRGQRRHVADGRDRVLAGQAEQDEALDRDRVEPRRQRRDRADLGAVGDDLDRVGWSVPV